jgi:hypothetical protein
MSECAENDAGPAAWRSGAQPGPRRGRHAVRSINQTAARPLARDELSALAAIVNELRDRVRTLEVGLLALQQQQSESGRRGVRDAADEHLLRAIAASALGTRFSAREVFRHRRVAPLLAAALQDADIVSVIQLGKLFRRLSGSAIDGLRLELDETSRVGNLWHFVRE